MNYLLLKYHSWLKEYPEQSISPIRTPGYFFRYFQYLFFDVMPAGFKPFVALHETQYVL